MRLTRAFCNSTRHESQPFSRLAKTPQSNQEKNLDLLSVTYSEEDGRLRHSSRRLYHASSIRPGPKDNTIPVERLRWGLKPLHEPTVFLTRRRSLKSTKFWQQRPPKFGQSDSAPSDRRTAAGPAYKRGVPESVIVSRSLTVRAVEKAIQKQYGSGYVVDTFGSTRYGISTASSDLDLVVLDLEREHGFTDPPEAFPRIYNINNLALTLKRAGFKILDTVASASVPIVKFKDLETGHVCDINVNDRLGVLNSDLVRRYCQLNPVLGDMIRYIKRWAKPLGLNSPSPTRGQPSTFSSYALVMMTIGFLQHRGLLPNLQKGLPPLDQDQLDGTFWLRRPEVMRCDVRYDLAEDWTPPREVPMHQLVYDWFRYAGASSFESLLTVFVDRFWSSEFNYNRQMICIRHGGCLSRSAHDRQDFHGLMWIIDPFIRSKVQNLAVLFSMLMQYAECNSKPWPQKYSAFQTGLFPLLDYARVPARVTTASCPHDLAQETIQGKRVGAFVAAGPLL
ncbi:hypothetical protein FB45DRAFT_928543 [Roridomyces roridus]|uniref:polynucleotide adenylyltransferase n=1 Tax=Roridomyces roridus TaxID=1738132 RepID=A0AAD7FFK7_9AGAR|nr:hypothetical protein FB45DRAFT_928543 [Roridomyces roridus]